MGLIGSDPCRIGCRRINDIHDYHYQWHVADAQPDILGTQHQKRFAEAGQGEYCTEHDDEPITKRQAPCLGESQRISRSGLTLCGPGIVNAKDKHCNRNECGTDRNP